MGGRHSVGRFVEGWTAPFRDGGGPRPERRQAAWLPRPSRASGRGGGDRGWGADQRRIERSLRMRSSVGGWVEKSAIMLLPDSGFTMKSEAVAGWLSSG